MSVLGGRDQDEAEGSAFDPARWCQSRRSRPPVRGLRDRALRPACRSRCCGLLPFAGHRSAIARPTDHPDRPRRTRLLPSPTVRVLLLVNSSASSVTARGRVMIQKALSADHDVTLAETSRRGHATRLAQGAAADGVEVVVVLGGDGTLNEAANGLAGTDTALAALPGGSTNVFARTLGLPDDAIEATVVLLEALLAALDPPGRPRRGQRPLLPLPLRHGLRRGDRGPGRAPGGAQALRQPPAVPLLGLRDLVPRLRPHPAPLRRAPARTATSSTTCTSASASTRTPTPTSAPARSTWPPARRSTPGWPWSRSARSSSPPSSGWACRRSARATASRRSRSVDHRADLAGVKVEGYGPFPYQVDGDYLGEVTSLEFRHEPESLALVIP